MDSILQKNGVSTDRLLSLCSIDELGGISKAAEKSGKSQSLLSRQVSELEEALGVKLLDRSVVPHGLTAEGKHIAELTRHYTRELDRFIAACSGDNEIVTIAAGESIIQWVLIPILSKYTDGQSGRIRYRNMRSKHCLEALDSGIVDLAFHHEREVVKDCETKLIADYGMCLVAKKGLLPGQVETWSDLQGLTNGTLATLEGSLSTRALLDNLCSEYPNGPQIGLECTSHPQILSSCQSGKIIGVVPKIADPSLFQKASPPKGLEFHSVRELSAKKVRLVLSYNEKRLGNSAFMERLVGTFGL